MLNGFLAAHGEEMGFPAGIQAMPHPTSREFCEASQASKIVYFFLKLSSKILNFSGRKYNRFEFSRKVHGK